MRRKNGQEYTAITGAQYNGGKQVKKVDYWPFWAYRSSDIYIKAKLFFRRLRHHLSSFLLSRSDSHLSKFQGKVEKVINKTVL